MTERAARSSRRRMTLAIIGGAVSTAFVDLFAIRCAAQEADREPVDQVRELPLSSLPPPPKEFADRIRLGRVRFITGGEPQSTLQKGSGLTKLSGETRFTFRYRYDSRATWQTRSTQGGTSRQIADIRVKFRSIKLFLNHDVWLRKVPPTESFWEALIVRHEMDHVRISADPRIENWFLDRVKTIERIRVPLSMVADRNGQVGNAKVQALIEAKMKEALDETTGLVQIRYRELDRLTQHGLVPIPDATHFFDQAPSDQGPPGQGRR